MKIKRLCAMLLAMVLSLGVFSTTAFAYVDESATTETVPETVVEETVEETTSEETEEATEPMDSLTPDGNLTLVDDEGSATGAGKQFITVVTKSGNYFYIIIDRDDEGEQTVHFLNQVDESDLLKLMDDEEAAQYSTIVEEPVETEPETETEVEVVEPEPEKQETNMMPLVGLVLVLAAGGGFFAYTKIKGKKKEEQAAKPDPDADYVDDEDYGYDESENYSDDDDVEYVDVDEEEI